MGNYGSCYPNMLAGERAQGIAISTKEEMWEVVGYLAKPGRVGSFEAEVPNDERAVFFETHFPGQKYRPIIVNYTPSGAPSKMGCQFRINMWDMRNCPVALAHNAGKGNASAVARINKSRFVLDLVLNYGFCFGSSQNVNKIREIAIKQNALAAFEKGYNR